MVEELPIGKQYEVLLTLTILNYSKNNDAEAKKYFVKLCAMLKYSLKEQLSKVLVLNGTDGSSLDDLTEVLNDRCLYKELATINEFIVLQLEHLRDQDEKSHDEQDYVNVLDNLEKAYKNAGRFEKAEMVLRKIIEITKDKPDEYSMSDNMEELANLYQNMERFNDAESIFNNLLNEDKQSENDESTVFTSAMRSIAFFNIMCGKYREAVAVFNNILESYDNEDTESLNGLNCVYDFSEDYEQAIKAGVQYLSVKLDNDGIYQHGVSTALNNLAWPFMNTGRYGEAMVLLLVSRDIRQTLYGFNYLDVYIPIKNIARVLKLSGNYDQAERYYLQARAILSNCVDDKHPRVSTVLSDFGDLYQRMGQYDKARKLITKVVQNRERSLGLNAPSVGKSYTQLARLFLELGELDEVDSLCLKALEIQRLSLYSNHPDISDTLRTQGLLYFKQNQYSLAETYFKQSMSIREAIFGVNSPSYAETLLDLARIYDACGSYVESEIFYKQSIAILSSIMEPISPGLISALCDLMNFYKKIGYAEKAVELTETFPQINKIIPLNLDDLIRDATQTGMKEIYNSIGEYGTELKEKAAELIVNIKI